MQTARGANFLAFWGSFVIRDKAPLTTLSVRSSKNLSLMLTMHNHIKSQPHSILDVKNVHVENTTCAV